jgi:lambda family phage portal protein
MGWFRDLFARAPVEGGYQPQPGPRRFKRSYAAASGNRSTSNLVTTASSADASLQQSLTALRSRSRALERDSSYAKRAKTVVVNNVVGSGIGMQAQVKNARGKLQKRVNTAIEDAFSEWARADSCHTGGSLHFSDLERLAMGQVFDAGEVFIRMHMREFGSSRVPFALEIVEGERVPERITNEEGGSDLRGTRMGVKLDRFHRPLAYWVRASHQNDLYFGPLNPEYEKVELVPASEMIHLRLITRWPQTRGVPWMHVAALKLNDMNGYSEAEIMAARAAANYVGSVERDDWQDPNYEQTEDNELETELAPGLILRPNPGEKLSFFAPNRPNVALDPFMRYMLREVAAGLNVSYESLSRDYSQSNYSSSRLALLDDRDVWRMLQSWFIRSFRDLVHRKWLQQAVFAGVIQQIAVDDFMRSPGKYEAVKFKPRGWTWVDPQKEVAAYKEAIRAGLTTRSRVISATAEGADIEDIDEERRQELDNAADLGLSFDTDPGAEQGSSTPAAQPEDQAAEISDEEPPRQMRLVQ